MNVVPVSVIIPAYNREEMVGRAVASALAQRPWPPAEVIVVDDGSSDQTGAAASRLGACVIRHKRNQGEGAARNTGIAAATQPWIALLDSDDEWLPNLLAILWPLRDGHLFVAGSSLNCGSDPREDRFAGPTTRRPIVLRSPATLVYPENFVPASGVLVRADAVREVGGYDRSLRYAADLDLWLRMLEWGTGLVSPQVVVVYHMHEGQVTRDEHGMTKGQLDVLLSYAGRPWWSETRIEARRAGAAWDWLRREWRAGRRGSSLRSAAWIAQRPVRAAGLAGILLRRLRLRRRSRTVTRTGTPTVGLLCLSGVQQRRVAHRLRELGEPPAAADVRRLRSILRLVHRPPAITVVDSSPGALVVRALGSRPIQAAELDEPTGQPAA